MGLEVLASTFWYLTFSMTLLRICFTFQHAFGQRVKTLWGYFRKKNEEMTGIPTPINSVATLVDLFCRLILATS